MEDIKLDLAECLSLEQIRFLPEKYNIGKRPLSLVLGWGEQTFSRYYNGIKPSKQYMEILVMVYKDVHYYLDLLEKNKERLHSEKTYRKTKEAAEKYAEKDESISFQIEKQREQIRRIQESIKVQIPKFNYSPIFQSSFAEYCKISQSLAESIKPIILPSKFNMVQSALSLINERNRKFTESFRIQLEPLLGQFASIANTISESIGESLKKYRYISLCDSINWPLYYYLGNEDIKRLLEPYIGIKNNEEEIISGEIVDFFDAHGIKMITQKWSEIMPELSNRKPIFDEAINLYDSGYYYGCVALLMTQINGLADDAFSDIFDKNGRIDNEELLGALYLLDPEEDLSNNDLENIINGKIGRSEKRKIAYIAAKIDAGVFNTRYALSYIYKTIFTSNDDMVDSKHPCRNKIDHGNQINFGTQEHAIKAFLAIDILLRLYMLIKENDYDIDKENIEKNEEDISLPNRALMKKIYVTLGEMIRHIEVVRSIHSVFEDINEEEKEFWSVCSDASFKIAVIDWCKIFANKSDDTHWTKMFDKDYIPSARSDFYKRLASRGISPSDYKKYINKMKGFRNRFTTHTDLNKSFNEECPIFDMAIESADCLITWYSELTGDTFEEPVKEMEKRYTEMAEAGIALLKDK